MAWGLRKLEKINFYFNLVAVISIAVGLSSIPMCYFITESKLSDEVIPVVSNRYELAMEAFTVYLPITYVDKHERFYDPNKPKKIKLDFDEITLLAFSNGTLLETAPHVVPLPIPKDDRNAVEHPSVQFKPVLTQTYNFAIVLRAAIGKEVQFRWTDEERRGCIIKTPNTDREITYFYCLVVNSWDDGYGLILLGDHALPFVAAVEASFEFRTPKFKYESDGRPVGAILDCADPYCRLATDCLISIDIEGDLQLFVCYDVSPTSKFTYNVLNRSELPVSWPKSLSDIYFTNNARLVLSTAILAENNVLYRPRSTSVLTFAETRRYTTLDITTISFSISSLIVTCFALIILLSKLLLFMVSMRLMKTSTDTS